MQRPLSMGVDIVMHSITKYINGHSDVIMGCLMTNDQQIASHMKFVQESHKRYFLCLNEKWEPLGAFQQWASFLLRSTVFWLIAAWRLCTCAWGCTWRMRCEWLRFSRVTRRWRKCSTRNCLRIPNTNCTNDKAKARAECSRSIWKELSRNLGSSSQAWK